MFGTIPKQLWLNEGEDHLNWYKNVDFYVLLPSYQVWKKPAPKQLEEF